MIYRVGDHAAKNMIHILSPKTVGAWRRTETGAGRLAAFQEHWKLSLDYSLSTSTDVMSGEARLDW